jgi:myo-inositol-1-phosphate synthase
MPLPSVAPTAIAPASGPLTVLLPGLGAVATTCIAGVELVRRGHAEPVGSLTQLATIRLGRREARRSPRIREVIPLAALSDLRFAAWDPVPADAAQAARTAGVLEARHLDEVAGFLSGIEPMPAAFDSRWVSRLDGPNVKRGATLRDVAEQLREDIRTTMQRHGSARAVMIWCGSTEAYVQAGPAHATPEAFEAAMAANDPTIAPSMLYAWAAIMEGVPFANGAPNLTVDTPALTVLAGARGIPVAGKDFKTGQTWLKTALAPAIKAKMLGLAGWYSTNILGNRDGEVLDDPASFKTKEASKLGVLQTILQPELYPQLYGDFAHVVRINYYPPRGDNKEGWDNVDIVGWLGYPMQIKINFLCRDSILAAPLVLDLALLLDFAARAGLGGMQEWLSFFFKSPMAPAGLAPEHDLFIQQAKLKNTIRFLIGEEQVTHLGTEYAP